MINQIFWKSCDFFLNLKKITWFSKKFDLSQNIITFICRSKKILLKLKILTKFENEISFLHFISSRFNAETEFWKFYWNETQDETWYFNLVPSQQTVWKRRFKTSFFFHLNNFFYSNDFFLKNRMIFWICSMFI